MGWKSTLIHEQLNGRVTRLLQFFRAADRLRAEFADCIRWWTGRKETGQAWKVPAGQIIENGCNLDTKNPAAKDDLEHLPPGMLVESIIEKENRILEIMAEIKVLLAEGSKA